MGAEYRTDDTFSLRLRFLFVICCSLAVASLVKAAEKKPASAPATRQTKAAVCCVWRVVNAKASFYLVGSVHALEKKDYPLPLPYETALNDSKRLVFEYNPDKDEEFQKKLAA